MKVLLKVKPGSTLNDLSNELYRVGGRPIQGFPPELVIAELDSSAPLQHGEPVSPALTSTDLQARTAAAVLARLTQPLSLTPLETPEAWDAPGRKPPSCERSSPAPGGPTSLSTGTPTSRVLVDSVAVAFVIVSRRDPASPEHMTLAERDFAGQEVGEAYAWLAGIEPRAKLRFLIERFDVELDVAPSTTVADDYEPMEAIWRDPALARLGHAPGRAGYAQLARDTRDRNQTKWGMVLFLTRYPVHHFAYASVERFVQHFDNDGWGRDKLNQVIAHETCHIFGALDEYGSCNCSEVAGELKAPNSNCRNCAPHFEPCIMERNELRMCPTTRLQLGWGAPFIA